LRHGGANLRRQGRTPSQRILPQSKQAIFLTAKSETTEATEITIEIIERFDALRAARACPG
jgi:phage regulator Rha-like protein